MRPGVVVYLPSFAVRWAVWCLQPAAGDPGAEHAAGEAGRARSSWMETADPGVWTSQGCFLMESVCVVVAPGRKGGGRFRG